MVYPGFDGMKQRQLGRRGRRYYCRAKGVKRAEWTIMFTWRPRQPWSDGHIFVVSNLHDCTLKLAKHLG